MSSIRITTNSTRPIYRLFPEPETVSLLIRQRGETLASAVEVTNARRSPARKTSAETTAGRFTIERMRWLLPAAGLGGLVPKAGDVVQRASGVKYTVESVDVNLFGNCIACETVRERGN